MKGFPSSARTALVETDTGLGYLKALGGPEGPHTLAAELVGTQLAAWLGLSTLEFAIVQVDTTDEIPFVDKSGQPTGKALPGPAFITRAESGESWSGKSKQLRKVVNPQDISRLVVFDTWTLNCDRYSRPAGKPLGRARINRNNVFLSEEAPAGQLLLKAIDHTHCFTCGREWTRKLAQIGTIRDERLFGLFPEFRPFLDRAGVVQAADDLRRLERGTVQAMAESIPGEWDVNGAARNALVDLVVSRAAHVADTVQELIWPQRDLDLADGGDTECKS